MQGDLIKYEKKYSPNVALRNSRESEKWVTPLV